MIEFCYLFKITTFLWDRWCFSENWEWLCIYKFVKYYRELDLHHNFKCKIQTNLLNTLLEIITAKIGLRMGSCDFCIHLNEIMWSSYHEFQSTGPYRAQDQAQYGSVLWWHVVSLQMDNPWIPLFKFFIYLEKLILSSTFFNIYIYIWQD